MRSPLQVILEGGPIDGKVHERSPADVDDWIRVDYRVGADGPMREAWYKRTSRTHVRDGQTFVVFAHVEKGSP